MSFSTTQRTLNSQTIGILNANSLHFIPISLFFLTFTLSAHVIVQFYFSFPEFDDVATYFEPFNLLLLKTILTNCQYLVILKSLITLLAFIFFVILPTVAGVALITYSTSQAIQGRPPTFSSTFKSLSQSYIPLLATTIAGSIKLILIFLLLTLSPMAITKAVKVFGFHSGPFILSIFINTMASYVLVITILYFMVIWGISAAIAVLESKSGFEPLQQSAKQLKEFRSYSFFIIFQTGFVILPSLSYSAVAQNIESTTNWILIMQVCAIYLQSSLMILYYVAANTVLYVQCKAALGEDNAKTTVDGDVSGEYVRVFMNEKNDQVSHEPAAMGDANGGFIYMMYLLLIIWVTLLFFMLLKHA